MCARVERKSASSPWRARAFRDGQTSKAIGRCREWGLPRLASVCAQVQHLSDTRGFLTGQRTGKGVASLIFAGVVISGTSGRIPPPPPITRLPQNAHRARLPASSPSVWSPHRLRRLHRRPSHHRQRPSLLLQPLPQQPTPRSLYHRLSVVHPPSSTATTTTSTTAHICGRKRIVAGSSSQAENAGAHGFYGHL